MFKRIVKKHKNYPCVWVHLFFIVVVKHIVVEQKTLIVLKCIYANKSQYWPRGAPQHVETAENEKA